MLLARHKFPLLLTAASFAALAFLMTSTNPVDNIIYAAAFFAAALVFLISLGFLVVHVQTGEVSAKNRYRIVSISLMLLTLLMFRSAQSLSWVGALILILIAFGLVFYISKR